MACSWFRSGRARQQAKAGAAAPPATPDTPAPPSPPTDVRVIRVTDERDGDLLNRTYSYWPTAWVNPQDGAVYAFVGHADGAPRFFRIDRGSGNVDRLGPLLAYRGTGEGWYFDGEGWIYLCDGPRLQRVNPFTGEDRVVFDISETHPGCRLWQAHSSDDGQAHSATVERIVDDGPYLRTGTVVHRHGQQEFFPAHGVLDESQVDASGRWLVIKEGDDNRIIDLETRETRLLRDADGAVGHSDVGHGILVGEDNIHGACVKWDLTQPLTPARRLELFQTWGMGVVSVRGGRCLVSGGASLGLVALDGSGVTPLLEHGMVGAGYDFYVRANLSPCGQVAAYISNAAGRFDGYLLVL